MKGRVLGIVILVLIVAAAAYYQFFVREGGLLPFGPRAAAGRAPVKVFRGEPRTLRGLVGSEKANFLESEQVRQILRQRYGVVLDYAKAGSIEMIGMSHEGQDFLWPSSQVALELYRTRAGGGAVKSEIIFNSPIVLYSWDAVTQALEKAAVARRTGETWEVSDFGRLVQLVEKGTPWEQVGLPQLYGRMAVVSTDPARSNSGSMFAGLLANVLVGGVVDEGTLGDVLPRVRDLFVRMGYLEHSTGVLFEQYLQKGFGAYPLIVGYENQIVEFSLQFPDLWPRVRDKLRILYPVPTVWSSHPLIALTATGGELLQALKDEELQRLAWEKHGFRSGLVGVENDLRIVKVPGIPETVTKVIPMPAPQVMEQIIRALGGGS